MRSNQEAEIFWKNHILKAQEATEEIGVYLAANNLNASSFYRWRKKLSKSKFSKSKVKNKKMSSVFLPVVNEALSEPIAYSRKINQLPEAKWVADILINLVVGLR